jgi:hypothetical protein
VALEVDEGWETLVVVLNEITKKATPLLVDYDYLPI